MNDLMEVVQALEDSNISLKEVTKTMKNETKKQEGGYLGMLIGTLASTLLGNTLAGKAIVRAGSGNEKGKGLVRAGYRAKSVCYGLKKNLILPHPLTNIEIQQHYENEPKFNGVFSRDNLPKTIKIGAYVINFDEYADVYTHWIALFFNKNEIVYFDSFGAKHVSEEIKEFTRNENIKPNIFRVQANNSIMCGYFCIRFIDFMLAGKKLNDFISLFSPYDFELNDDIFLSYFKDE